MTIYEIWRGIRENPILGVADPCVVNACLTPQHMQVRELEADAEICSPEYRQHFVGILLEGRAAVHSADGGRNVRLRTVGCGALFGVATLFSCQNPFPTRITAASRCRVLFLEAEAFRELIRQDSRANEAFMTFLCDRVVYLNKRIAAFTAGSAERRLALFLCDNACDDVCIVDVSFSALAQMLDVGRASLYRALDALEAEGMICREDKTVTLLQKDLMLKKYTCGT